MITFGLGVASRYALRSLGRNARRTALSVVGIAFGVGVALFGIAWIRGEHGMTVRAAAGSGVGHLRVAPPHWLASKDDDLRLDDGAALLARVRGMDEVAVATPHARTGALVALGTRSVQVELTGVDAATEPTTLRFVRHLAAGRWLEPGEQGAVVLGRALVERLDAELDDQLVVMSVDGEGQMQSSFLVLVGIAESGSREIDAGIAETSLADVAALTGRSEIAEITVLARDENRIAETRALLAAALGPGVEVLTYEEVAPALVAGVATDAAFMNMAAVIVLVVVLLGVASAQLTAVLERRREFAVLAAVGMRTRSLVRVVLSEGTFLGVLSALVALAWAAPLISHLAVAGVDLRSAFGEEQSMAVGGVLLDPIFYPESGAWIVPTAFALSLLATVVASLYPAAFVARTDPASALRVDR